MHDLDQEAVQLLDWWGDSGFYSVTKGLEQLQVDGVKPSILGCYGGNLLL